MATATKDVRLEDHRVPKMPTATRVRYGDGRVLPVGGGLWLYRKAPLAPVSDAKTHAKALEVGDPIAAGIEELAAETPYTTARRSMARARYRPFHLLLVNLPRRYSPPEGSRHGETLQDWFGDERTQDRLLLMGTRLNDVVAGTDRTIGEVIDSVATSMTTYEVPMADYQQDLDDVSDMMTRSGFTIPTPRDFHLAESWWAAGGSTGASLLPHADHLHVTPGDGINTAVSMLRAVNLWPHSTQNFEADLQEALKYGVSRGAKAIGTALENALTDGKATAELVDPILRQSRNDPLSGAMVGLSDDGQVLSAAEGITYIKVGNANLELPPMGVDQTTLGLTQRVSAALIRMMLFGSAEALRGRRGVLMLDEAWVFLGAGAEEMERLGRLARSLEVFPILFTQRISDLIEANLTNYIARGIILHTKDPKEAEAAFRLFAVEPTPERLRFTTAPERIGKGGANFGSRKPLFEYDDKDNRVRLFRGAIGLYCDLDDRAVDVEIKIPADFLAKSSTNALDRARREGRTVI